MKVERRPLTGYLSLTGFILSQITFYLLLCKDVYLGSHSRAAEVQLCPEDHRKCTIKLRIKHHFSTFSPSSYVVFLPQFHSFSKREKVINVISPSKDTPKPKTTYHPHTPTHPLHSLLMLFEDWLSMYLKFKPQMLRSIPGETTAFFFFFFQTVNFLYNIRVSCYFYLAGLALWGGCFLGILYFHILVNYSDSRLFHCAIPLSNRKT